MSVFEPVRRKRKPPLGRRCHFCGGNGLQAQLCSGEMCRCGGDGHVQRCYWCDGTGLLSRMVVVKEQHDYLYNLAAYHARWADPIV